MMIRTNIRRSNPLFSAGIMAVALAVGCAQKPPIVPAPQAPSSEQAGMMKEKFLKVDPTARVGVVSAVVEAEKMAMVIDIETDNLKSGEVMSFVDGSEETVAHGTIAEVLEGGKVAVRFEKVKRAPGVGDVAVKF